jgi:hypothetical protein
MRLHGNGHYMIMSESRSCLDSWTTYANRITEMIGYRWTGIKRPTAARQRTTGNTGEAGGTLEFNNQSVPVL